MKLHVLGMHDSKIAETGRSSAEIIGGHLGERAFEKSQVVICTPPDLNFGDGGFSRRDTRRGH